MVGDQTKLATVKTREGKFNGVWTVNNSCLRKAICIVQYILEEIYQEIYIMGIPSKC